MCHQSASKHGRHTFIYSEMRELVWNEQLWATAAVRQLRSHNVAQREYLATTVWRKPRKWLLLFNIFWHQHNRLVRDYHNKSLMTILRLAGVLFCKMSRHGQNGLSFVPKKILTWVPRESREGLKPIAGKRQQLYYHFIHTVFCYFLFLSATVLFSLLGYARSHFSTSTLWA